MTQWACARLFLTVMQYPPGNNRLSVLCLMAMHSPLFLKVFCCHVDTFAVSNGRIINDMRVLVVRRLFAKEMTSCTKLDARITALSSGIQMGNHSIIHIPDFTSFLIFDDEKIASPYILSLNRVRWRITRMVHMEARLPGILIILITLIKVSEFLL